MNKSIELRREKRKITELARKYSKQGYKVFADISNYDTPYKIIGISPDIIVKKDNEIIIIEVKSSESLKENKDIVEGLAKYAKKIPNTRFDLVLTNPKPVITYKEKMWAIREEITVIEKGLLKDAKDLIDCNKLETSIIILNRILEGLLVHKSIRKGVKFHIKEQTLLKLAEKLKNKKIISNSVYELSRTLHILRNKIVHGYAEVTMKEVLDLYYKVSKLINQWRI